ncbi:glycoside hydrolase family 16 protein [Hypoxylon rubiginosum]|uniref:Glycoside hydrolase family 16 protein n=1 Tax=Hypoxylon rubiginosum TaxID=110542 RepID=A0ACB9Z6C2_9PEZI|nr:glycoside hydrolase family 16 protein [Hypoxylon rubiginosum]
MAPSLLKTVGAAAAVLATQVAATSSSYQVTEVYNTTNFFDKFNFVTSADPNGGYVQYQSRSNAENLGIVKYTDGTAYVGVDYTKTDYDAAGAGRKSVRLESKNVYNHGLIIADFTHLPKPTCGSWPAFWFFGEPWPTKGEIDVYENWNDLTFNRHTAHVDAPSVIGDCKIVSDGMTSTIDSPNCYDFASGQAEYQGCSASKYSSTFGSSTGGVYAMEWTSDFLKIWEWSHLLAPSDVTLGQPSPNTLWGTPSFVIKKCDVEKAFKDMKMVLNIDFCAVAGQTDKWASCKASTGYDTCAKYVAKKAGDFSSVNFKVKDIKVYQLKDTQTSTTSSTISTSTLSTISTSTSSATLSTSSSASVTSSSSISSSIASSITSSISSSISITSSYATSSSTSSHVFTNSSSAVSSTVTSSALYSATSSTVSDDDDDYCTDDGEETSSSYIVSPTVSVSATTTGSSSGAYITSAPVTSSYLSNSYVVSDSASEYPGELTTSTIYATSVYTVTSCAPTITNCPAGGSYVTTEVISIGVTVCPVTETGGSSPQPTTTVAVPEGYTTSTVKVTKTYTITSCAATVTNCPVGSLTTEVSTTTTLYPIENGGSPATSTGVGSTPAQSTAVVAIDTPGQSTGVATKPETEGTAATTPEYVATTTYVATPEATSGSSETDVLVTATVVPVTSAVYTGYYPTNANATLATSVATSAGVAASSSAGGAAATTGCTGSGCGVVEVSGGVKAGASLALVGVAVFALVAM